MIDLAGIGNLLEYLVAADNITCEERDRIILRIAKENDIAEYKLCHIKRREAMLACSPAGATDMALISGDMGVTSPDLNVLQIVRMVSAITIFPQIIHAIVPLLP